MEMPLGSPFLSPTLGVDKARIVRHHLQAGRTVAFAGDGFPDEEAALLTPGCLRFAYGELADVLKQKGETFQPFDTWSQIARQLFVRRVTKILRMPLPADSSRQASFECLESILMPRIDLCLPDLGLDDQPITLSGWLVPRGGAWRPVSGWQKFSPARPPSISPRRWMACSFKKLVDVDEPITAGQPLAVIETAQ